LTAARPTILQIIPELETGGAELSTIEIAEAIVAAGGRALVLSEGGRLAAKIAAAGAEFVPFAAATKNPLHVLWNARVIARMIADEGVALVHARSRAPAWSAYLAASRTKTPFVTTYHGAYSEKSAPKRLYNSVMAKGDVVIANSRYTADLVHARYGTPREKIRVIYRGVDGRRFDPAAIGEDRLVPMRREWGLKPGDRVILNAARLTAWKGQSVLIEAIRRLDVAGKLDRVVVILAGDDQGRSGYRGRLKGEITAAGLNSRVHLVGHVADIPAAFQLSELAVVASSEPEAFGRAAIEAQVMGCPVIATDIGAPPETVIAVQGNGSDSGTGWLVPPSDPAALAGAIETALALKQGERTAMGARARRHVLDKYSLDEMRRGTLAVYDALLGSRLAV